MATPTQQHINEEKSGSCNEQQVLGEQEQHHPPAIQRSTSAPPVVMLEEPPSPKASASSVVATTHQGQDDPRGGDLTGEASMKKKDGDSSLSTYAYVGNPSDEHGMWTFYCPACTYFNKDTHQLICSMCGTAASSNVVARARIIDDALPPEEKTAADDGESNAVKNLPQDSEPSLSNFQEQQQCEQGNTSPSSTGDLKMAPRVLDGTKDQSLSTEPSSSNSQEQQCKQDNSSPGMRDFDEPSLKQKKAPQVLDGTKDQSLSTCPVTHPGSADVKPEQCPKDVMRMISSKKVHPHDPSSTETKKQSVASAKPEPCVGPSTETKKKQSLQPRLSPPTQVGQYNHCPSRDDLYTASAQPRPPRSMEEKLRDFPVVHRVTYHSPPSTQPEQWQGPPGHDHHVGVDIQSPSQLVSSLETSAPNLGIIDATVVRRQSADYDDDVAVSVQQPSWCKRHQKHIIVGLVLSALAVLSTAIGLLAKARSQNDDEANEVGGARSPHSLLPYYADWDNGRCINVALEQREANPQQKLFETLEQCCAAEFWDLQDNECMVKSLQTDMMPTDQQISIATTEATFPSEASQQTPSTLTYYADFVNDRCDAGPSESTEPNLEQVNFGTIEQCCESVSERLQDSQCLVNSQHTSKWTTTTSSTKSSTLQTSSTATTLQTRPAPVASIQVGPIDLGIIGSILDYSSFDYTKILDGSNEGVPSFYNAQEVMTNKDMNNVFTHVVNGFGSLMMELMGNLYSAGVLRRNENADPSLEQATASDIACPAGLKYAPENAHCLRFKVQINTGKMKERDVTNFSDMLETAINNEGKLYDVVKRDYPGTIITGLGNPGKGIDYTSQENVFSTTTSSTTKSTATTTTSSTTSSSSTTTSTPTASPVASSTTTTTTTSTTMLTPMTIATESNISYWPPKRLGQPILGEGAGDKSGYSVALSSNGMTLAIGAPFNNGNGQDSGSVRVYHRNANGLDWSKLGQTIVGEAAEDYFGRAVSISSDGLTLAIGASGNSGNGMFSGHVRIYKFSDDRSSWQLIKTIYGNTKDQMGVSLSLSSDGKTIAVGAPWSDKGSIEELELGYATVFQEGQGSTWSRLGQIIYGDINGDERGGSVSISSDGTTLAVGAKYHDGNGQEDSGHVIVYKWDVSKSSWKQLGQIITGEAASNFAGHSLSLSGNGRVLAIGSPSNSDNGVGSGDVKVYGLSDDETSWNQLGQDINGEKDGDNSGWSVSLSATGNILTVGCWFSMA